MFNLKRVVQFLAKLLAVLLPILGLVFVLSLVTELWYREADWADVTLWLAVARDMVPSIVALLAVYLLATRFVQALYKIEDFAEARGFVNHCLFGLWSFRPWLKVEGGIAVGDEEHILMRAGGPGHLVVYNDSAALLERGGQFTLVQGKGFPRLEPFEKIYDVVDLRPKRWVYEVEAMSKEGIPITCEADISYQIDNEGLDPTKEMPFPASEQNVFQAATCTWIREANRPEETRTMDWSGRVIISETEGSLRTILSQCPLDRLIGLSPEGEDPRGKIRRELEKELNDKVPKLGARILGVELGDIKVKDEITQQWIEVWQAEWERWATERQALGEAEQAEQLENAKTRAQVMMLTAITEAFQPLVAEERAVASKLVLTRLFMLLSRAPSDPLTRRYLPQEAINTLKLLQDLIV